MLQFLDMGHDLRRHEHAFAPTMQACVVLVSPAGARAATRARAARRRSTRRAARPPAPPRTPRGAAPARRAAPCASPPARARAAPLPPPPRHQPAAAQCPPGDDICLSRSPKQRQIKLILVQRQHAVLRRSLCPLPAPARGRRCICLGSFLLSACMLSGDRTNSALTELQLRQTCHTTGSQAPLPPPIQTACAPDASASRCT